MTDADLYEAFRSQTNRRAFNELAMRTQVLVNGCARRKGRDLGPKLRFARLGEWKALCVKGIPLILRFTRRRAVLSGNHAQPEVPVDHTGRSKGFGFVRLADDDAAEPLVAKKQGRRP